MARVVVIGAGVAGLLLQPAEQCVAARGAVRASEIGRSAHMEIWNATAP